MNDNNIIKGVIDDIVNNNISIPHVSAQRDMLNVGGPICDSFKFLTKDEIFKAIPAGLASRISYTPMIMSRIAFKYGNKSIDIIKKRKMYKMKQHTKLYETSRDKYEKEMLFKCSKSVIDNMITMIDELIEKCQWFITVYYYSVLNAILKEGNTFEDDNIRDIVVYAYMSLYMIRYIKRVDDEFDKVIKEKIREFYRDKKNNFIFDKITTIGCTYDEYLINCHDSLIRICKELGYPIEDNENLKLSVRTLRTETDKLINEILEKFKIDKEETDYDVVNKLWEGIK